MRKHNATFANFVCRFGEQKVLLDYADEIVIPAFTRAYVRTYGERTHCHFYNVELVKLEDVGDVPVLALAGRFIKNTELTRHQIFDARQGLVQDERSMASSPSAYFVLILNNHRLIYFPETPHAPDFSSFGATCRRFLVAAHSEYVEGVHRQRREDGDRVTKQAVYEEHPRPTLDVIPLTGQDSVEQFMRRYEVLKRIDFRLVRPNDDIVARDMLAQVMDFGLGLNSTSTAVSISNRAGLDIEAGVEAVVDATAGGNQEVSLNGVDQDGNRLSGNNHQFQISVPLDHVPTSEETLRTRLYEMFKRLMSLGTIRGAGVRRRRRTMRRLQRRI